MLSRVQRGLTRALVLVGLFITLGACSDGRDFDDGGAAGLPQPDNPVVEGPVSGGGGADCCIVLGGALDLRDLGYEPGTPFFTNVQFDLAANGYRQDEYFISGTASSYVNTAELEANGEWSVAAADAAAYKSRIVVTRPEDPADFNGTVVVEWFNVSAGLDTAPDFLAMQTEIIRSGYAWVGVSAQKAGVDLEGGIGPLVAFDPARYGSLFHPGDSFSYDIFSQAAQAVLRPQGLSPLGGLEIERAIAAGQSQSADRMVTYVNAVHPTLDVFDGFIVHARGTGSSKLSQEPQVEIDTPDNVLIREDLVEPVLTLQTQTEVVLTVAIRQADTAYTRYWEVAGSAHSDVYTALKAFTDQGDDPAIADVILVSEVQPPFVDCDVAANDGPGHWLAKTALDAVDRWIRFAEPAPSSPLVALTADSSDFVLDEHGNATGGIRTPYVDVPVATFTGIGIGGVGGFCRLFGTTELFEQAKLQALYPSNAEYVEAINRASDTAVAAGFLLEADAQLIKAWAPLSGIGGP